MRRSYVTEVCFTFNNIKSNINGKVMNKLIIFSKMFAMFKELTYTAYFSTYRKEIITLKHDALYNNCTTWPILVFEAWGKWGSNLWTTNMTSTFLERAEPSSKANKTNFKTSSCMAGKQCIMVKSDKKLKHCTIIYIIVQYNPNNS